MLRFWDDPVRTTYQPFFDTKMGQLLMASARKEHVRDGLAGCWMVRLFPLPEYSGIHVEPSRPSVVLMPNVIIIGRSDMFRGVDIQDVRRKPIEPVGATLEGRLAAIRQCCYQFDGRNPMVLKNTLTGERFSFEEKNDRGLTVDYGVIRRIFSSPFENTFSVEGIHSQGTHGAAKVATTPSCLRELWKAVEKLGHLYDPTKPLEILVRTTFDPDATQEVFTPGGIEARPLNFVFDRTWIFDLETREWVNQEPYDIVIERRGEDGVGSGSSRNEWTGSTLDIEVDLRDRSGNTRELAERFLRPAASGRKASSAAPGTVVVPVAGTDVVVAHNADRERLLQALTADSDRMRVRLHERPYAGAVHVHGLPDGTSEIRMWRKKFLIHVVFSDLLELPFVRTDEVIERHYPDFAGTEKAKGSGALARRFTARISARIREGFERLFWHSENSQAGRTLKRKDLLSIVFGRRAQLYSLRLERARLLVKIRV